jgi:hypothetical protein
VEILNKILKKKIKEAHLYKGCSDLSIYNFDACYKTKDLRYLVVGFDGYANIVVPREAKQRWSDINDEWIKITDNSTIMYYYQLISEVTHLETRYIVAEALLHQMSTRDMNIKTLDMYIEALKGWRYIYNKENTKEKEIERLYNQHRASQNKLDLKQSELEDLQKNYEDNDSQTLEAQAVALEQVTGRNNIDTKKTSVLKWHEICKLADSINEQRRKQYGK